MNASQDDTVSMRIPHSVWLDFLDPLTSQVADEIGLPQPRNVTRGKGSTDIFDGVTVEQAQEVAGYLFDRADTLLGQGVEDPYDDIEKRTRATYRSAIKTAERIWGQVGKPVPPPRPQPPRSDLKFEDLHVGMRLVCIHASAMQFMNVGDIATVTKLRAANPDRKPGTIGSTNAAVLEFEDGPAAGRSSGGFTSFSQFEIAPPKVLSAEDHGTWRGRRSWTVRVIHGDGDIAQYSVLDVLTEVDARIEAIERAKNRRKFTPEEKEALRQSNEALRRGLS